MADMVEVPWADGTVRELPVGSVVALDGDLVYVDDGGYQVHLSEIGDDRPIAWYEPYASAAFTLVDPPIAKIKLPTRNGTVIRIGECGYVRVGKKWFSLLSGLSFPEDRVAELATKGFDVLFEGIEDNE